MLRQDGEHALYGAEDGSVHYDWALVPSLRICVPQLEAVGELKIQLYGGALELPPQGIKHRDVDLRAVECSVPLVQLHDG